MSIENQITSIKKTINNSTSITETIEFIKTILFDLRGQYKQNKELFSKEQILYLQSLNS